MESDCSEQRSTRSRVKSFLSKPQEALLSDAVQSGVFMDSLPESVRKNHHDHLGIFGAPGIRAVTYAVIEGDVMLKTFEARDLITFQCEGWDGRVDVSPFGDPCQVHWRPDAGETDASVQLELYRQSAQSETSFIGVPREQDMRGGEEYDVPHIVIGWVAVPQSEGEGEGDV